MKTNRTKNKKQPLSQALIVKTAFELLNEHGLAGMTMRKIAKELDTGASSLYVYVENHEKLSTLVLDYGLMDVNLQIEESLDWKDAVIQVLFSYVDVLQKTPGLAHLAMSVQDIGVNSLNINECLMQHLQAGGISKRSIAWGTSILLVYVTALAFEHSGEDADDDPEKKLAEMASIFDKVDPLQYPMITLLKSDIFGGEVVNRFKWGIELILQGMLTIPEK